MIKDIPITEARHALTSMPERLAKEQGALPVTRRGKPVLAILQWDFYESLIETLEILSDKELIESLRQGIAEAQEKKGIPWEKAKRDLGL